MRSSLSVAALLAIATSAFAQTADSIGVQPTPDFDPVTEPTVGGPPIDAGSTTVFKWTASEKYSKTEDMISIQLLEGADPEHLVPAKVGGKEYIATDVPNSANQYSWLVPLSLGSKPTYGIKLILKSNPSIIQYSPAFKITPSADGAAGEAENDGETATVGAAPGVKTLILSSTAPPVVTPSPLVVSSSVQPNKTTLCTTPVSRETSSVETSNVGFNKNSNNTANGSPAGAPGAASGAPGVAPSSTARPGVAATAGASLVSAALISVFGGLAVAVLAM